LTKDEALFEDLPDPDHNPSLRKQKRPEAYHTPLQ